MDPDGAARRGGAGERSGEGMKTLFGTDGVRGRANEDLTPELAVALGRAAAAVLGDDDWLVGWDTRVSSTMLAGAFSSGVASAGRGAAQLGVLPTAGVAYVCREHGRPGAMVTASHNPYHDNGIKIFTRSGEKLPDEVERKIEEATFEALQGLAPRVPATQVGNVQWRADPQVSRAYRDWLVARAGAVDGSGLRIGVDCANGASYALAPDVVAATGATVFPVGDQPDGRNINDGCGSTDLTMLAGAVVANNLDLGLALDGDADRLVAVDAHGQVVDGDEILAVLAHRRSRLGTLTGGGVVVTEWSNLGLLHGLRDAGISVEVSPVGDRAVAAAMRRTGYVLGGEQSGHLIIGDLLPVGDGLSTAIELVAAVVDAAAPLGELATRSLRKLPQVSLKVTVPPPSATVVQELERDERVVAIRRDLGDGGRLVLRASGTEAGVIRVLIEAAEDAEVDKILDRVVEIVAPLHG
jgi:phosphoglucosamine mutase